MASYLLYGCNLPLFEAMEIISTTLQFQFEERESDYHAGVYFLAGRKNGENFELKKNIDPFDGEPLEQDFPEHSALFFINATDRVDYIQTKLNQIKDHFVLLRNEHL